MKAITVIDKNYTLIYTGNVQPCVLPIKKVGYASSLENDYNLQMDNDIVEDLFKDFVAKFLQFIFFISTQAALTFYQIFTNCHLNMYCLLSFHLLVQGQVS